MTTTYLGVSVARVPGGGLWVVVCEWFGAGNRLIWVWIKNSDEF
jgi:hypothetical protein